MQSNESGTDIQLMIVRATPASAAILPSLIAYLPNPLPVPVIIAAADPNDALVALSTQLQFASDLPIACMMATGALRPGTVHLVSIDTPVTVDGQRRIVIGDAPLDVPSSAGLFESAATAFGDQLIAVVLHDAGTDGANAALVTKEAGGTVLVERGDGRLGGTTRLYAPTTVDVAAPIDRIGPVAAELLTSPVRPGDMPEREINLLLGDIRERHGIDFTAYKTPTIRRRLLRRMITVGTTSLSDYRRYLTANPDEESRLTTGMLIKVTRFFRDPALFAFLRESVLPQIIDQARAEQRELRIWSAGCATGEEAYSLAILIAELLGDDTELPVRIFATDLDEEAVTFARRGVYPAASLSDLPAELIDTYFSARDGTYEVRRRIRGMLVFGQHDLGQRPPFPNLDMVVCRNVMIYFTEPLQRRILETFAYALHDGGYLVLGTAETARPADALFTSEDRRQRVYRRHGRRLRPRPTWPANAVQLVAGTGLNARGASLATASNARAAEEANNETRRQEATTVRFQSLLRRLPLGVAVVDRDYDIVYVNAAARQLLGLHGTGIGQDVIHAAQHIPPTPFRHAIDAVLHGKGPTQFPDIVSSETAAGETIHLSVSCQPDSDEGDGPVALVMVLIEDVTRTAEHAETAAATEARLRGETGGLRASLERMTGSNRSLLKANRELSDTVDELRRESEDLRVANAAAQVAAEEIETLNEEFQATNEELETLNEETQATLEELNATNDELSARTVELEDLAENHATERARLSAILASLGEAVVVVDADGRLVRTNAAYDALAATLDTSLLPMIGAGDIGGTMDESQTLRARASRGERFETEFSVASPDGTRRWFEAAGRLLRGPDAGGVLVIRETTDRQLREMEEQFLHIAGHELRSPLTALQGYLQLAQRRASRGDDERLVRHIDLALAQVQRQSALINQLMDVGRLRNGKLSVTLEPTDLVPLLEHVIDTMRVITPNLTFTFAADRERIMVMGDALRIEQIAINLITNAATHARGTRIAVHAGQSAEAAEFRVEDDGVGIPQDQMQHIFERLTQVARPAPDNAGLGLGLYIAREIAQAHDGSITVESAVGEGTTFTVRLPLAVVERDAEGETEPVS